MSKTTLSALLSWWSSFQPMPPLIPFTTPLISLTACDMTFVPLSWCNVLATWTLPALLLCYRKRRWNQGTRRNSRSLIALFTPRLLISKGRYQCHHPFLVHMQRLKRRRPHQQQQALLLMISSWPFALMKRHAGFVSDVVTSGTQATSVRQTFSFTSCRRSLISAMRIARNLTVLRL